jgi:hypothetical protein
LPGTERRSRPRSEPTDDETGLWNLSELTPAREDCDLLVLPFSLREALARLLSCSFRVRAGCVAVLGGVDDPAGRDWETSVAIYERTSASGIFICTVPETCREQWPGVLLRQLSRNEPLGAALHSTCRLTRARLNLVLAFPGLFDAVSLLRCVEVLQRSCRRLEIATREVPVGYKLAEYCGFSPGLAGLAQLAERLLERLRREGAPDVKNGAAVVEFSKLVASVVESTTLAAPTCMMATPREGAAGAPAPSVEAALTR